MFLNDCSRTIGHSLTFYSFSGRWAQWLPEIRHFLSSTPAIALVEVDEGGDRVIPSEEGSQVAEQLGALFVRCSRKSSKSVVVTLVRAAFEHQVERERKKGREKERERKRGWKLKLG
jgi:Ras family